MCEHCINDEYEEVTEEDINYWKENGKYFGYPQCCIDEFCNRDSLELSVEQESVIDNHGFIPCQEHSVMILQGKTTLKDLITNRKCTYEYPMDDYDAQLALLKFYIEEIN
jgi:hypothetical protein